ncbi:hypothetical protein ARAM_001120 [Aspergillus rambellii]|uniref:O-methylsterigmatocystin oxidoreductase n=2 Tax=Aspergillus subgen. Nidulantes TaxID=2720870 RepID=A0A0F8ULM0_9EURO|nr:hypothetical protein ARAM_001120 [Aspergillus rambellii]KKK24230.1 hypothetical protein AOCH_001406 [Aspergillus ochraceoroseus]
MSPSRLQEPANLGDANPETFASLGPIASLTTFGQIIILINNAHVAIDLMERKSAHSRTIPDAPFAEMAGWGKSLATARNMELWKGIRKNIKVEVGTRRLVSRFHSKLDISVRRFLVGVLADPDELRALIRKEATGFMLNAAYGYTISPHGRDPMCEIAQRALGGFEEIFTPGNWLVNFVPILRHVPSWLPGTGFLEKAAEYGHSARQFTDLPFHFAKHKMAQSSLESSMLSRLLEQQGSYEPGSLEEDILKWSAAEFFLGGSDTSVSIVTSFFLAMALYPDVQQKARAELDQVIGEMTLPKFEHRSSLPYINAIVKETFRWHPSSPLGAPHILERDEIYQGYLIPRGALLLPNICAITQDTSVYHDPRSFKPERFLASEGHPPEADPAKFVFGFGRRICPGRFLIDEKVFLVVALTLACLDISPKDPHAPEPKWQAGLISHPGPFDVKVVPRSPEHEALIRSVEREHPPEASDADDFNQFAFYGDV